MAYTDDYSNVEAKETSPFYKVLEANSRDRNFILKFLNKEYENGYELIAIDPPKVVSGYNYNAYSYGNSIYIFKRILKKEA